MAHLGPSLKLIRVHNKITQQELADYVGVTREDISRFEGGLISLNNEHINAIGKFFQEKGITPSLTVEFPMPDNTTLALAA